MCKPKPKTPADITNVRSLRLKIVHGAVDQSCYNLTIEQLWDMLAVAAKYGLKVKATNAKTWFEKWYDIHPLKLH